MATWYFPGFPRASSRVSSWNFITIHSCKRKTDSSLNVHWIFKNHVCTCFQKMRQILESWKIWSMTEKSSFSSDMSIIQKFSDQSDHCWWNHHCYDAILSYKLTLVAYVRRNEFTKFEAFWWIKMSWIPQFSLKLLSVALYWCEKKHKKLNAGT